MTGGSEEKIIPIKSQGPDNMSMYKGPLPPNKVSFTNPNTGNEEIYSLVPKKNPSGQTSQLINTQHKITSPNPSDYEDPETFGFRSRKASVYETRPSAKIGADPRTQKIMNAIRSNPNMSSNNLVRYMTTQGPYKTIFGITNAEYKLKTAITNVLARQNAVEYVNPYDVVERRGTIYTPPKPVAKTKPNIPNISNNEVKVSEDYKKFKKEIKGAKGSRILAMLNKGVGKLTQKITGTRRDFGVYDKRERAKRNKIEELKKSMQSKMVTNPIYYGNGKGNGSEV